MTDTRVVVLANLKGGSAKTTSAAFIAHAFYERGHTVILVDADPQGSALRWAGEAEFWTVPCLALPTNALHRQLWGVVDRRRYCTVVIDTPPLEDAHGIVMSALRVATDIVVPMAPTMMELDRVPPVWQAIEDTKSLVDHERTAAVLLNRVVPHANSTDVVRAALTTNGRTVMTPTIPRRETYAQAFGVAVPAGDVAYGWVAEEISQGWERCPAGSECANAYDYTQAATS